MIRIVIFIICLVLVLAQDEFPIKCQFVERSPGEKYADYDYDCVPASEEDMRGEKGARGDTGAQGPTGPAGPKGDPGESGADGATGSAGPPGIIGAQGPTGPKGNDGSPGVDGMDGSKGEPGERGIPGGDGPQGSSGLPGVDGIPGNPGVDGIAGNKGIKGEPGEAGSKGERGEKGMTGPPASNGEKGIRGSKGEPGTPGNQGETGKTGANGSKGSQGAPGFAGTVGEKGEIGNPGLRGPPGQSENLDRFRRSLEEQISESEKRQNNTLQTLIESIQGCVCDAADKCKRELEDLKQEFVSHNESAQEQLEACQTEVQDVSDRLSECKSEIVGKAEELEQIREEFAAYKSQATENIQRLTDELEKAGSDINSCKSEKEDLITAHETELQQKNAKLQECEAKLEEAGNGSEEEIEELNRQLADCNANSDVLRGEKAACQTDLTDANELYIACEQQSEELTMQQQQEINQLNDELEKCRTGGGDGGGGGHGGGGYGGGHGGGGYGGGHGGGGYGGGGHGGGGYGGRGHGGGGYGRGKRRNGRRRRSVVNSIGYDAEYGITNEEVSENCKGIQNELNQATNKLDYIRQVNSELTRRMRKQRSKEVLHMRDRVARQKQKIFGTSQVPEDTVAQLREQLQAGNDQLDCLCDVWYDGKCYWVKTTQTRNINSDKARVMCGCGTPADIISQQLYDELSAHVRSSVFVKRQNAIDLWLGMTYDTVTEEIRNSDGTPATFIIWLYGGYPLRKTSHTQLALNVNRNETAQGMWNSVPEYSGLRGVICQK